jgi:hypothetical protein
MSDFDKKVIDVIKETKNYVNSRADVDRQVKEQVQSDLDGVIEKHENPKGGSNPLKGKYW